MANSRLITDSCWFLFQYIWKRKSLHSTFLNNCRLKYADPAFQESIPLFFNKKSEVSRPLTKSIVRSDILGRGTITISFYSQVWKIHHMASSKRRNDPLINNVKYVESTWMVLFLYLFSVSPSYVVEDIYCFILFEFIFRTEIIVHTFF